MTMPKNTREAAADTNSHQQYLRERGVNMVRVWNTNNDTHVCAICQSFEGQTEDVWGKQFPKGPPAHEGCRCDITLQLDRSAKAKPMTMTEQIAAFVQRLFRKRNENHMDKKLDAAGEATLEAVRKNIALMPKNADVFSYDPYTEWYLPGVISKTDAGGNTVRDGEAGAGKNEGSDHRHV